jgi:hypothetical protein
MDILSHVAQQQVRKFCAIFSVSKQMYQHTQQSRDEHSEAAGPCQLAGILLGSSGTEHEASSTNFFQPSFFPSFLGGTLLLKRTGRAGQTLPPIETAGVVEHSATSGAQL